MAATAILAPLVTEAAAGVTAPDRSPSTSPGSISWAAAAFAALADEAANDVGAVRHRPASARATSRSSPGSPKRGGLSRVPPIYPTVDTVLRQQWPVQPVADPGRKSTEPGPPVAPPLGPIAPPRRCSRQARMRYRLPCKVIPLLTSDRRDQVGRAAAAAAARGA